jgi:hypothetical protein
MSFISLFGIFMLINSVIGTKNNIISNFKIPAQDISMNDGTTQHFNEVPTNYTEIVFGSIVGILAFIFIIGGIVMLWDVGPGLYGVKFLN